MKIKQSRLTLVVALAALAVATIAVGADFDFGGLLSDRAHEDRLSFRDGGDYTLLRRVVNVPEEYGRLVTIESRGDVAEFWYEDSHGAVRNVIVNAGAPVIVSRAGEVR